MQCGPILAPPTETTMEPFARLPAPLGERRHEWPTGRGPEPLAMEYTTALLLAESAFENYASLSAELSQQVDTMLARLDAAGAGRVPPGGSLVTLDELGRRAQERLLLAHDGRDIHAQLPH